MAEVVLEHVCKTYPGGFQAVADVSLHIADREFIVLVGPSGCGKSTTLRMVAGLEDISSGVIRIGSRVVNDVAPKGRNIAMVFQNYALYPHMTVYRNMAFALMLRRKHGWWDHPLARLLAPGRFRQARAERESIDQRVRATATMLGIDSLLQRRPKELSGGQRQRVAVGRAIVREPQAFLFDEPLSNLDAKLRVEMRAELKRLHRRVQTTTIYVTHDQEEAMTLGDRVVVMKEGVIQQVASPFEVYERPANRFVASFVGTPPMNFLAGRLTSAGGRRAIEAVGARLEIPASRVARLGDYPDGPVTLGIRPEHLSVRAEAPAPSIEADVNVVEPLGDRMDVSCATPDGVALVCRLDTRTPLREGERVRLMVDMERAHLFERFAGERNLFLSEPRS